MTTFLPQLLFDFNDITEIDTEIMGIFHKSMEISGKFPEILSSINNDLDIHGIKKKHLRVEERRYSKMKRDGNCYVFDLSDYRTCEPLTLETGRPRLKAELVLFFLTVRGIWGSISDHASSERIKDSISISLILSQYGYSVPGINTIRENLNAVSNCTRKLIQKCQAALILEKGLDDFSKVYIDSTHVEANTAYPTDVSILYKLLARVHRSFLLLEDLGFPVSVSSWMETRQRKMKKHLSFISMNVGKKGIKGKVKERFTLMVRMAEENIKAFYSLQNELKEFWENCALSPEKGLAADQLWFKIDEDIYDAQYVLYYSQLIVNKNIKLSSTEKILSISDIDAAFIAKGQRVPVIGYKPQIARSGNGFICGCLTPKGNTADSEMLIPVLNEVIAVTAGTPDTISTDDCYGSEDNVKILRNQYKIHTISINGAKGKKLTAEDWDTSSYINARNDRSAVESSMFTLKYRHSLVRLRRRGLAAVNAEILEKVIAYNFIHMIRKEKEKLKKAG